MSCGVPIGRPGPFTRKHGWLRESIREIENNLGRDAKDSEVAEHMGIGIDEYNQILQDSLSCKTFSVEELLQGEEGLIEGVYASTRATGRNIGRTKFSTGLGKSHR